MAKPKVTDGRKQPGVDKKGKDNITYIKENSEFFGKIEGVESFDDADIFRIAVALTIKHNLTLPDPIQSVGSNVGGQAWGRNSLETEPPLTTLVEVFVPQEEREEIWTYIERAAASGLEYMKEMVKKDKSITDMM